MIMRCYMIFPFRMLACIQPRQHATLVMQHDACGDFYKSSSGGKDDWSPLGGPKPRPFSDGGGWLYILSRVCGHEDLRGSNYPIHLKLSMTSTRRRKSRELRSMEVRSMKTVVHVGAPCLKLGIVFSVRIAFSCEVCERDGEDVVVRRRARSTTRSGARRAQVLGRTSLS